ncbi:MAG: alpha/beta hydrolase fold domain-containing protein, partial [Candidatus Sumerlaeota bacterium]|nr:alpha/beta hydrolase fold domain-containing protein [Candidatus Sumerlaeota bacterium]
MMTNRVLWMALPVMAAMLSGHAMGGEPRPRRENAPRRPPASQPAQASEGARLERDLEYGRVGEKRLLLDLYLPENAEGPLPLIVWVHGGGWQSGSKEQCLPARQGFVARGYAVASVNYRLSGEAPFPAQIEDCKASIRWLRANAKTYKLDPDRIGVWGSSAGGHLVALLGTSGEVKEWDQGDNAGVSSRVQAVCDFYGPTDLAQFVVTPGYEGHAKPDSPESKLIGGAVLDNKDKAARANPIPYVDKGDPPFLIVHGDSDPVVPPPQGQLLYDALQKAGVESSLHFLSGAKHGGPEFNAPDVVEMVAAFFDKHLKGLATRQTSEPPALNSSRKSEPSITSISSTASISSPSSGGLLFFASYPERANTAAIANPNIAGALHTMYWSDVEKQEGVFDWSGLDGRIRPWVEGGKKVALRIMWSSSGRWPEPAAKHPTPRWVFDKGAKFILAPQSQTEVPLPWDPIYQECADGFLREVARKFDGDPNVLFIDVTPGAETNPYRGRMDQAEPAFKPLFLETAASDGRRYSDQLWLETVRQYVDSATSVFTKTKLLVTLNNGGLEGQQFHEIGAYCVAKGCMVGQNGLRETSYIEDSPRRADFLEWGKQTPLYFEMNAASGPRAGALMEIMKAAERIGCDYLCVYAVDVLKGTQGQPTFDPAWEEALRYGAQVVENGAANPTAQASAPQSRPPESGERAASRPARPRPDENAPPQWVKEPIEAPNLRYETFHSATIDGPVSYLIYLPTEYEKSGDKRYPVMYWLHGRGGAQTGLPAFCERLTKAIEAGKTALSCGYTCDLEHTPGNWMGIKYDAIQRNIRYNHMAVVKAGRAGDAAKLHM